MRAAVAIVAAAAIAAGLSSCAPTTYDASLESTPPTAATTTTVPSGPAAELLPRLLDEGRTVSQFLVAGTPGVTAAVERVDALWLAARDEVMSLRPDLVTAFDENVARIGRGAGFKRVADIDKSLMNLAVLVDALEL